MSLIESIANLFEPPPAPLVVTVNTGADYENLPHGFFNVISLSGRKSLGYNGGFLSWNVGATVVDGGQRITLTVPKSELPTARLNFQTPNPNGSQQVGGATIIDTDSLDTDEPVVWSGQQQRSGVGWV